MRYRPQPHVIARAAGKELILIDGRTQDVFAANESAAGLWEALAAGQDSEELGRALAEACGVPEATDDVRAFVQELLDRGFLGPA